MADLCQRCGSAPRGVTHVCPPPEVTVGKPFGTVDGGVPFPPGFEGMPVIPQPTHGVSPCFVNCGEPACQKLGCVKVYNADHRLEGRS